MHQEMIDELKRLYQNLYDAHLEIASLNLDPYQSEITKELHEDLCFMQSEYPEIGGNRENGHFKSTYADIEGIVLSIKPLMKKYHFSLTCQERLCLTFGMHLRTRLTHHKSGQWIETRSLLNSGKPGDQEYGKMLTYRTRYSIKSLLCIPISKDPADDDGEQERKDWEKSLLKDPSQQKGDDQKFLTVLQLKEIKRLIEGRPDVEKMIKSVLEVSHIYKIPTHVFEDTVQLIETLKKEQKP